MSGPAVSVVLVAYGDEEGLRAALDAVRSATPEAHEVIVVDNPKEGDPVGEDLPADVVLRNRRNVGFGLAVNQGAMVARADRLAVLNPDAVVPDGWLPPLLDALAADPAAAAAAPVLVGSDGAVQEVGSVATVDGHTLALGRDEAAGLAGDRHVHAVDYVSAACVVLDRAAFVAAGGFDAGYGLGYFEDADLAMRLAARGRRVLVVPSVRVVHAHHASFGAQAAAQRMVENRPRFTARWAARLAGRPPVEDLVARPYRAYALRDLTRPLRLLAVLDGPTDPATVLATAQARPDVAVTLAAPGPVSGAPATVEVVRAGDVHDAWLRRRLMHYPLVALDEPAHHRLVGAITALQAPSAVLAVPLEGDPARLGADPDGH